MYRPIMAIRDFSSSSAVTHIDLENTGMASTAMSMIMLQAPWMMSSCVSRLLRDKTQGDTGKEELNIRHRHGIHTGGNERADFV